LKLVAIKQVALFLTMFGTATFIGVWANEHGKRWQFGRFWMPKAMLKDADHYADGQLVCAWHALVIKTGHEEEFWLVAVSLTGAFMVRDRRKKQAAKTAKHSLDVGLLRWNQQNDCFTRRHLLNGGVLVMGRPGSGKSSSSGAMLARSIVADEKSSILVLASKPEDAVFWENLYRQQKRELLVVSPRGLRCNMLDYLVKRGADSREIVSFITVSAEVLGGENRSGGEHGQFFENEEKRFLIHAVEILRQAGVSISAPRIQNFITSAAQTPEQLASDAWRAQFQNQCLRTASVKENKSEREKHDFELARDAWVKEWPFMADKTRSGILACILDKLFYFNSGIGREALSTETTCSPDDLLRGKSILVNYPPSELGDSGAIVSSCWKYLTQRTILARTFRPGDYYNIIWCDEAYNFTTSFDQTYANSSRSYGGAMVYLVQSRDSFYSALGTNKAAFANGLMGAFAHKIFHSLGSPDDAEWASSLLGRQRETAFGGSILPPKDSFDAAFGHLWGRGDVNTSFNESWQPVLQPRVFLGGGLRCGGPENNYLADAIVVRSGEPFANNQNWIHATFSQR
jgi:hypothetical protein